MSLLAVAFVLAQLVPAPPWSEKVAPGLVFEHGPVILEDGIVGVRWRGRTLFAVRDGGRGADDHVSGLRVLGRWAKDGLRRWVFVAPGIDDCSAYGLWVLDLRDGKATLRRADYDCYQGQPSILRWTPRAQALVPRSNGFKQWWAAVDLD